MKIIDALKDLPLIEKKIIKNIELINKYASYGSHVGAAFEGESEQKKEVSSLVQANNDLVDNLLSLRKRLNITNATVEVTIEKLTYTVAEWIAFRQTGGRLLLDTYNNLNINKGSNDINTQKVNLSDGVPVAIVRCFDEKSKNNNINEIQDVLDQIDATLEKVNATTDLVD